MLRDINNPDRLWLTRREHELLRDLGVRAETISTAEEFRRCVSREFNRAIESLNLARAEQLLELLEAEG